MFSVSLQTSDLLRYLIKRIWHTASIRLSSLLTRVTSRFFFFLTLCPWDTGIQQFIITVFVSGPPMTERKVQPGGFLQKNWSHRNELRLIFHDIKKRRVFFFLFWFFFLASVLILLNLMYLYLLLQSFSIRQTIKEFHSKIKDPLTKLWQLLK